MSSNVGPASPQRINDTRMAGTVSPPKTPMYPGTDGSGAAAQERLAQSVNQPAAKAAAQTAALDLASKGRV